MTVQEFMTKSGASMHMKGYDMLKQAIELRIANPDTSVGDIFLKISIKSDCTIYAVEKNIKTVLLKAYPLMDQKLKNTIFMNRTSVTVAEYIKNVAYAIRNRII